MEWLVILALAVWVWLQGRRIGELTRQLEAIERSLDALTARTQPATGAAPAPQAPPRPGSMPEKAGAEEPLLLDTPVPLPSNDANGAVPPVEEDVLLLTEVVPPEDANDPPVPFPPAAATPPPRKSLRDGRFEQWLAENGLAWLGGAMIALAAITLVSVAAQQNWFTPKVQLTSALVLGVVLTGLSEWTRRIALARPPGHPLVAAMLAGAGVVTFYACAWAAHGLYGFIGWAAEAMLLALCAVLLIGLSFLHGQALGVLAIVMALLTPPLAREPLWPSLTFIGYIAAAGAAGLTLATLRRWAWVGAATLGGLYFWFSAAIVAEDAPRALALASLAAGGGLGLAFRQPLPDEPEGRLTWTQAHAHFPGLAISVSSVLLLWAWMVIAPQPSGHLASVAWVGGMFVLMAALAVRARAAPATTLIVAIAALAGGFILYLRARTYAPSVGASFYPFVLFASLVVTICTVAARPHRSARTTVAATGAVAAALLTTLAAFTRGNWHHFSAWLPLFIGAGILATAAWVMARSAGDARTDRAVALWCAAAAALLFLGVESAFDAVARTDAYAAASALLIGAYAWRGWTMLRHAALAAAAFAIGHALSPALVGATLAGALPLITGLAILALAAVFLVGAGYLAARIEPRALAAEALTGAATIIILIGGFVALRWFAAGGAGAPLDAFTETSLRIVALMAAGHVVLPRAGQQVGRIGAWRGHVLMGLGLLYTLFIPTLVANPWWGGESARVLGPPVFDTLLLAFAAPAALALAAASRLYTRQRTAARIYAGAGGLFALTWALLALRRAFHVADMPGAPVGLIEGTSYAFVFLAGALAVNIVARMRAAANAERPFTHDLTLISRSAAWGGIVVAALILLVARHPWWGLHDPVRTNDTATLVAVIAHAAATVLALILGRALSRGPGVNPTRFAAAAAAVLFAWSFGHGAIRWLYHRGAMDNGLPLVGLEGLAHALWPLALVLAGATLTARAPDRDTVRAYIYDLQALWASAIWPALAYAALGFWLLFNPWWGVVPAEAHRSLSTAAALAAYLGAAWLSALAPETPRARWPAQIERAATIAVSGHLFVALTLIVRRSFHHAEMSTAAVGPVEAWIYPAAWALFGAVAFWLGMGRADVLRRWIGLAVLVGATAYVLWSAFTRLTGFVQVGSMIGVGAVLLLVTWFARTSRLGEAPDPVDPLDLTTSVPRERRHGRR